MVNKIKDKILNLETVLATLQQEENIFDKFKIKTLAIFGSTVSNKANENSDLDFLVEFNDE
jgi:hypothetical protein